MSSAKISQTGYPPQGQTGYLPQGQAGYPPQGQAGYPSQTSHGYPGGAQGYPPQGYPPQGQVGNPGFGSSAQSYPAYGSTPQTLGPPPNYGGMGGISAYYSGRPTVRPVANFNPSKDADDLRKAMRGLGTDEAAIISILSNRTFDQRVQIATKYLASFGKDLKAHLKSELSGRFEDLVLLSIGTLPEMLATTIYEAVKGSGTDEQLLIQAIIPYSNSIIRGIAPAYQKLYGRDVIRDVRSDTSRDFEKILVAMLQGHREENVNVNMSEAAADAELLYNAGEKILGTEEAVFTRILAQRSFEHIKAVNEIYRQKYGHGLDKAVSKETSGDYKNTMLAIVNFAVNKTDFLAEWFYKSMKGLGTDDWSLMQLTLGRSEIDLQDVKEAYQRKYGKTLAKAIEGDTSGDYKRMFLALVGN
nr:annexin [Hymenolepis microstoma]